MVDFTGEEDIDKLTAHFLKQEEENFALFNYVNELNDELEGLQTRVAQLRDEIDEARALNVHRGCQQAETLERISKQLEDETVQADEAEARLNEVPYSSRNLFPPDTPHSSLFIIPPFFSLLFSVQRDLR